MTGERLITTSDNPLVVQNPKLGLANFIGEGGRVLMEKDQATLADIFSSTEIAKDNLPKCNAIFLYCALETSGRLPGARFTFRDIIGATGAHVAVLANELSPSLLSDREFTASLSAKHAWPANIVITLNRQGDHFGAFFRQLFSLMLSRKSMPMAWVELAPQGPQQRTDIPGTICLMEAGHIAFAQKRTDGSADFRMSTSDRF